MHKVLVLLAVVLSLALGAAVVTAHEGHDGTPPAEAEEIGQGVAVEFLGLGEAETLPPGPAYLQLVRITIEPGGSAALPEYPATALASIESGAVTLRVDTPITVVHIPDDADPGRDDFEHVPANEEVTLEEGDSALFPPNIAGEVRNDGEEATSILVANIFAVEMDENDRPAPIEASTPAT
jgi:quercetin dioxygenase-like cupin family protein